MEGTMANACLFIGWNRALQGREHQAMEHGGDMNGFILLRGDAQKLAAVRVSPEFIDIETQSMLCLQGVGVIQGYAGEGVQSMLASWNKHLAKYSR
jgi:hypothetical protein